MSRPARVLVSAAAALATIGFSAALPAHGSAPHAIGAGTITVFLKAPDPAALDRLAAAANLSHAQRVLAVEKLVPSDVTHARVIRALSAQGYREVGATAWSITLTGSPARTAELFGTRPTAGRHADLATLRAASGALPRVPAALAGAVSAVFPTTGGPAVFHHSTSTLAGPDFRNADTPATVTPSTGANDTGNTIATLQLADFYGVTPGFTNSQTAADLTHYATDHGLADPVADHQYLAVKVDGGPAASDDLGGGDIEVNLDQESILSTAPSANQHAYFAPNTDAGFDDVFANVYDDVVGNAHATAADPHIMAMSVSWGACERLYTAASIQALEPIIKSVVAAGVTVFASSGDAGIYDCGSDTGTGTDNSQADVDYPSSSPSVVSTGGSNLSATTSAPNTGTNWKEKAWSCTDPVSCQNSTTGTGGGGGGASGSGGGDFAGFAKPLYQQVGVDAAPFKASSKRLVPDITADGDPSTGFVLYTSDLLQSGGQNNIPVGGTSLASPISAAQLTNALSDAGRTTGVGDIHPGLYSAYLATKGLAATSPSKVFRDVTSGSNGAAADKGADPSVSAATGFDTVSGVGGVLWSALVPYLTDTHHPTVSATLVEPHPTTTAWRQYTASWSVTKGADTTAVGPTTVKIVKNGTTVFISSAVGSGSRTFNATPGATYVLTVTGSDIAGRKAPTVTKALAIPVDDSVFTFAGTWRRGSSSTDFGGSDNRSSTKGATAKYTVVGRAYSLQALTTPSSGKLGVYFGGKLIKTIDLHTTGYSRKTFALYSSTVRAARTFIFKVLGTKAASSKGYAVGLDSMRVAY